MCLLEVTQIGKTCLTPCAIYHAVGDCVMPKEGIFVRVLSEGMISVGDEIDLLFNLMQTFLPYPDFKKSLQTLDYRRLGKQRVEAYQILRAIKYGGGWQHHPVTKMWRNHINALKLYHNLCIDEWVRRGYKNSMEKMKISGQDFLSAVVWPRVISMRPIVPIYCAKMLCFYGQYGWQNRRTCLICGTLLTTTFILSRVII